MDFIHDVVHTISERLDTAFPFFVLTLALLVGPRLAERAKLPAMVGLVLAGMAVGPHGFQLLHTDKIALSAWGQFGLLYLMFAAGLELDLRLFAKMRKAAITFAVLSFIIPFSLGIIGARVIGFNWPGAILMGSNWGSHTLVTYPMLRQMGLARNRAVATVVGATAVTDTSALLVLTGVSASVQKSGSLSLQALEVAIGLAVLVTFALFVLPRLAHWFFGAVGTQSAYRFVFGMLALLAGAVIAEAASIDGIVGAFFAGLGLTRVIPERSTLMDRVQFFGSALFIPIFLISVGTLLDPRVLASPKTLLIAALFTVAVLGGKALAAIAAGRIFRFEWSEIGVMAGLSGSQAAATLATTLIGAKLGVFDTETINAVLVVILASLIATPAMVAHFGKNVKKVTGDAEAMGALVMVPVRGGSTRPLLGVAGTLAAADGGIVMATSIAPDTAPDSEITEKQALCEKAKEWLAKDGYESKTLMRVAPSITRGLLETLRGEHATLVLKEWNDPNSPEIKNDEGAGIEAHSPVPVVLAHGALDHFNRLLLLLPDAPLPDADDPQHSTTQGDIGLATDLVQRLGNGHPVSFIRTTTSTRAGTLAVESHHHAVEHVETRDALAWARDNVGEHDLVVLPGLEALRGALERIPHFAESKFLVAVAPRVAV